MKRTTFPEGVASKKVISTILASAIGLAGLQAGSVSASPRPKLRTDIQVIPNFSKLTVDGTSCEGGYPRPCALPLQFVPDIIKNLTVKDILNQYAQEADGVHMLWPTESYGTHHGDRVKVVCQVLGGVVSDAYNQSSHVWDVVEVPDYEMNSAALTQVESNSLGIGVSKDQFGDVVAYAYAPSMWLGDKDLNLHACTAVENPQNYPTAYPVHTK